MDVDTMRYLKAMFGLLALLAGGVHSVDVKFSPEIFGAICFAGAVVVFMMIVRRRLVAWRQFDPRF